MIRINDFIDVNLINLSLKAKDKPGVLIELSELLKRSSNISQNNLCYEAIVERERIGSTGIGKGVAIPHAKTECATQLTIGFGISKSGIEFESLDGEKTHLFFVFASPKSESQVYLKILARISRLIRSASFRKALLTAKTPEEIVQLIVQEDESV